MLPKDTRVIKKMMERIATVLTYCMGLDYEGFSRNTMLTEACVFNLLQIGEMCNQDLSDALKIQYNEVPWRQIYGLRNRIVHGYDDVNMAIIWETIRDDLPKLYTDLATILQRLIE